MPEPIEEWTDEDLFILHGLTQTPFLPQAREDEEAAAGSDAFVENESELVGRRRKRQNRKYAMPRGRGQDRVVAGSWNVGRISGLVLQEISIEILFIKKKIIL